MVGELNQFPSRYDDEDDEMRKEYEDDLWYEHMKEELIWDENDEWVDDELYL